MSGEKERRQVITLDAKTGDGLIKIPRQELGNEDREDGSRRLQPGLKAGPAQAGTLCHPDLQFPGFIGRPLGAVSW
jgi:hypothetical protein